MGQDSKAHLTNPEPLPLSPEAGALEAWGYPGRVLKGDQLVQAEGEGNLLNGAGKPELTTAFWTASNTESRGNAEWGAESSLCMTAGPA